MTAELGDAALTDASALVADEPWLQADDDAMAYVAALASGAASAPAFPLRGADLLALGVNPGPAVGAMMAALRTHWLEAGCPEGKAARAGLLARAIREEAMANQRDTATLTDREKEILQGLAQGLANKLIARNLDITEATVKVHVKNLLKKLGFHSRLEAAVWAVGRGTKTHA